MAATSGIVRKCWQLLILSVVLASVPAPCWAAPVARELASSAGLSEPQLRQYRAQLASSDGPTRTRAITVLSELSADTLPAIEARLEARAARRLDPEASQKAMRAFRHAVGSRRADDELDIAPGVSTVLASDRSAAVLAIAEPLLLLRSLERLRSREATLAMAHIIPMDEGLWRQEMRLARKRGGMSMLPAMIELRSHPQRAVKAWAQYGVRTLGMKNPKAALALEDPHMVAQVISAYARPLEFAAMPEIVRMVASPHVQVREAARATVGRFRKNAIWQLREYYEELTGRRATRSWNAKRTAQELYTVLDRRDIETADTAMARGMKHLSAGELPAMAAAFDEVLRRFPEYGQRDKMVPGYAALGAAHLHADRLPQAAAAYRRALWLGPGSADERAHCEAQLSFIDAELSLTRGVVDLDGYDRAIALQSGHALAETTRDRLSGATRQRARRNRRMAAYGALPLLLGIVVVLWRRPREDEGEAEAAA